MGTCIKKKQVDLWFIAAQEEQQTFILLLVALHICSVPVKQKASSQA